MARSVPPPAMEPDARYIGARIDKHLVLDRCIGVGGMSVVYATRKMDEYPDRAVKMLRSELFHSEDAVQRDEVRKRFEREARLLMKLGQHENIMTILEYGVATNPPFQGEPYIVMPLMQGKTVDQLIDDARLHPRKYVMRYWAHILSRAATGLTSAHEHVEDGKPMPIIHRDVKPSNIFVIEQRGTTRVVLTDFGIARHQDPLALRATQVSDNVVGTLEYMAPEQATGEAVTPAADVYALGVVAYELFSGGHLPIEGCEGEATQDTMRRVILTSPRPLQEVMPDCTLQINALVMACLAKRPSERPTIRQFLDLLEAATGVQTVRSVHPSVDPRAGQGRRVDLTPPRVPLDLGLPPVRRSGGSGGVDEDAKTREWSRTTADDVPSSGRMSAIVFAAVFLLVIGGIGFLAWANDGGGSGVTAPVARLEHPDAGRAELGAGRPPTRQVDRPDASRAALAAPDAGRPRPIAVLPRATAPPDPAVEEHRRLCRAEVASRHPSAGWLARCEGYLAARCGATAAERPVDCGLFEIRVRQEREARRRARERRRLEREAAEEPDEPSEDG